VSQVEVRGEEETDGPWGKQLKILCLTKVIPEEFYWLEIFTDKKSETQYRINDRYILVTSYTFFFVRNTLFGFSLSAS